MNELEEIKEEEEELMCQISRLSLKLERLKVKLNEVKKKTSNCAHNIEFNSLRINNYINTLNTRGYYLD